MDSMNIIVAKNIKRLREEKKLSMDELVKLSGVSKSMLAQIERGGTRIILVTNIHNHLNSAKSWQEKRMR